MGRAWKAPGEYSRIPQLPYRTPGSFQLAPTYIPEQISKPNDQNDQNQKGAEVAVALGRAAPGSPLVVKPQCSSASTAALGCLGEKKFLLRSQRPWRAGSEARLGVPPTEQGQSMSALGCLGVCVCSLRIREGLVSCRGQTIMPHVC